MPCLLDIICFFKYQTQYKCLIQSEAKLKVYMDIHWNFIKQAQINILCAFHFPKLSGGVLLQSTIDLQIGGNLLLIPKIISTDGRRGRRTSCNKILKQLM